MIMQSPGLRMSFAGAVIFAIGMLCLLVLPPVVGVLTLLVGGFAVWAGFIRTLFAYYGPNARRDDEA